jgi:hypothetical protein
MTDSRRPNERWSPFEQDLLSAGKDDAPARGARRKTLIALGVGTGGALGSSATASGSAAGPAATTATVAGAASKLAPIAVAKWIALGVLGIGAVAAAVHTGGESRHVNPPAPVKQHVEIVSPAPPVETHPVAASIPHERGVSGEPTLATHARESTASEPPAPTAAATRLQRPAPVSPETRTELASPLGAEDPPPVPSSDPAAVQNETAAPPATTEATTASPARSSGPLPPMAALPADDLAEEMSSLEAARASLRRGDTGMALRELARYASRFPHGLLEPESIVLRIETQLARGDRAGGAALGRRFLAAFPGSPLAPRVKSLLGP